MVSYQTFACLSILEVDLESARFSLDPEAQPRGLRGAVLLGEHVTRPARSSVLLIRVVQPVASGTPVRPFDILERGKGQCVAAQQYPVVEREGRHAGDAPVG